MTKAEARARADMIDVTSYEVFLDLTADPVRSRTEIRFGCRTQGAATFAELEARALGADLNGRHLEPAEDGRLRLPGLADRNVLTVDAEVASARGGLGLTWFTDPVDGARYASLMCYPTHAPSVFCCFDQLDLVAELTVSMMLPAGWECVTNGPAEQRPAPGQAGLWRFATVRGARPFDLTFGAGPYVREWHGDAGTVALSIWRRRSLAGAAGVAQLARFGETARQALAYYERALGVPSGYSKYDIAFVPELTAAAASFPGLMQVNENLLARLADPDDDFVAMVCAHEVAHLWFGCRVSTRWWDDLWLDEAMATYMSYTADLDAFRDPWTAFAYREKPRAYLADTLPGRLPVSSPVDSSDDALFRPPALTYSKGAAVIRQLAALIGDRALRAGLTDYLMRFAGRGASLDGLFACWSRASDRDLSGWADQWLRTEGTTTLRAALTAAPDGTIGSLAVTQDVPRTHRIGIGLFDADGSRLVRRRVITAEISGGRTEVGPAAGEVVPDAIVLNDGDLSYAAVEFDGQTLEALARAAMDVGDPLTEAVGWNAAWSMVRAGSLAAADFAGLVIRRLPGDLPPAGVEVLLEQAVSCADVYAPPEHRAALRARVAEACRAGVRREVEGSPRRRALAAGFAASGQDDGQLQVLRSWLDGGEPAVDADLRGRILRTLAARGLATEEDLEAQVRLDPVGGQQTRATCRALRPDAAAKQEAWAAALSADMDWRTAVAWAQGIWVPGQEELLAGYRDRYFGEALAAIDGRELRMMRHLGRMLYPAPLVAAATLKASRMAAERAGLSRALRLVVLEQAAVMNSVIAARAAMPRGWLTLYPERAEVGGDVEERR